MASCVPHHSSSPFFDFVPFSGLRPVPQATSLTQGLHSRVRLIGGGADGARHLAGVEIALDPGFKTYGEPPEIPLPPAFDWSGSRMSRRRSPLARPTCQEDAGGTAYVYGGAVILPAMVTPKEGQAREAEARHRLRRLQGHLHSGTRNSRSTSPEKARIAPRSRPRSRRCRA